MSRFTLFQHDGQIRVRWNDAPIMFGAYSTACGGSCSLGLLQLVSSRFSNIMCQRMTSADYLNILILSVDFFPFLMTQPLKELIKTMLEWMHVRKTRSRDPFWPGSICHLQVICFFHSPYVSFHFASFILRWPIFFPPHLLLHSTLEVKLKPLFYHHFPLIDWVSEQTYPVFIKIP